MYQKNETAAILVPFTNPVWVELYTKHYFINKFEWLLVTWVEKLYTLDFISKVKEAICCFQYCEFSHALT